MCQTCTAYIEAIKNERDICQLAYAEVIRKNQWNKIAGSSNDSSLAFKQIFLDVSTNIAKFGTKATERLTKLNDNIDYKTFYQWISI